MLELRIKQGRKHVPLFELPSHLGSRRARIEIGATVEGLIAFLDELGGDPDLENDRSDFELGGDDMGDTAWIEWSSMRGPQKKRHNLLAGQEDDECNDPLEEDDDSGQCTEDEISSGMGYPHGYGTERGPGCTISDAPDHAGGDPFPSYGVDQAEPEPWSPVDDLRARRPHRDRIRATRCEKVPSRFYGRIDVGGGYQLLNQPRLGIIPSNNN